MVFTIPKEDVLAQLLMQLKSHFFITEEEKTVIETRFENALAACEENFSHSENKYYFVEEGGAKKCRFNPYHAIQYMTFLYYLSHDIYKNANIGQLCDKVYYLNKIFHSVDLFYAIELPAHFGAEHPLGAVMGRAKYNNGFFFYQGCTVGGTRDKQGNLYYPELGENVHMYSNSSILGNCHIGNNVNLGAGCIVKNQDVPDNSIVFGQSPNLIIKTNK
jgi:serine O-acetyltransferase